MATLDINSQIFVNVIPLIIEKLDPQSLCNLKKCNKRFNTEIKTKYKPYNLHMTFRSMMQITNSHNQNMTHHINTIFKEIIENGWFSWLKYYYEKLILFNNNNNNSLLYANITILAAKYDFLTYDNYQLSESVDKYKLDDNIEEQYTKYVPKNYNFRMIRYLLNMRPESYDKIRQLSDLFTGVCSSDIDSNIKFNIFCSHTLGINIGYHRYIKESVSVGNLEIYHKLSKYVIDMQNDEWIGVNILDMLFESCKNKTKNITEMFNCIMVDHFNTTNLEKTALLRSLIPSVKNNNKVLIKYISKLLINKKYCTEIELYKLILEEACCVDNSKLFVKYVEKIGNKDLLDHEKYMCDAFTCSSYDIVYYLMENYDKFTNIRWNRYFRIILRRNLFTGPGNEDEFMFFKNKSDNDQII